MSLIRAATDASGTAMGDLSRLAVKLGADTAFSANDAAEAMLELAKAGIDVRTIMRGGIQGTLTLAAAGGTELGTAATIASNALNAFGLAGKDMASVAAVLAGGANASSASVESLGQGLQQVGPGARNAGLSLQETVAALSAFDAAGIKGSDAGTSLKTMLARLVPQTNRAQKAMEGLGLDFVKGNGEFESLENIAGQLQQRLGKLSAAQRTTALNTIFGSDASRAATVLLNEGTGGIRKFIRATNDQGAAQRMAKARMEGTAGALERLSGVAETAKLRIGQELRPVVIGAADGLGDKLLPALESTITGVKDFSNAVEPAVTAVKDLLEDLVPSGEDAGSMFNDVFIPAVRETAEIVATVANALDALPQPVKDIGVQAGIAALILPRFTAAVGSASGAVSLNIARLQQLRAEMTYTATRAQVASSAMTQLSGAARAAAGVGGMVALTQAASTANSELSALMNVGGGALLGFSAGGPVGAAIGGTVGALLELKKRADNAGDSAQTASVKWETFAGSLDQTTGAMTRQTRATVVEDLAKSGLLNKAASLGINQRTLVNGILGESNARRNLNAELIAQERQLDKIGKIRIGPDQSPQQEDWEADIAARRRVLEAIRESIGAQRKANDETVTQLALINQIPKKLQFELQTNTPKTIQDFARLAARMNLTPRRLSTVLKLTGADFTVRQVRQVQERLRETGRIRPDFGPFNSGLGQEMGKAKRNAISGALGINTALGRAGRTRPDTRQFTGELGQAMERGRRNVRGGVGDINDLLGGAGSTPANMGPFIGSIQGGIGRARGTAASQAPGVGNALADGVAAGVRTRAAAIGAEAVGAVTRAIRAAKYAARIASPSGRMRDEVGKPLADGLIVGMRAREAAVARGGQRLIESILRGARGGSDGIDNAIERITAMVERGVTNKDEKKERAREKAILKNLKERYKLLRQNGAAQDRITRQLEAAVQRHKQLVQASREYASTIREGVVAFGSVTALGEGTGFGSLQQLIDGMQGRADAAEQFADAIERLRDANLNDTTLQQLIDAGPQALGTAQTILAGIGTGGIRQINAIQQQLAQTGRGLGNDMARHFHAAGVQAAAGLVRGLRGRQRELDQAATRMANALVRAVRRQLGIKSPSRVFEDLGDLTMRGLELGLDDTRAKRAGAALAAGVKAGYARPTLSAAAVPGLTTPVPLAINLRLTADQVDQLSRGRAIQADLDAYRTQGGRRLAVGGP